MASEQTDTEFSGFFSELEETLPAGRTEPAESIDLDGSGNWAIHPSADFEDLRVSRGYDRDSVESVWECAEVVRGNDRELWRKDEFGDWIYRHDFGNRASEFGWEIFDPGVGRHAQGVYAMRPMQWKSFLRQFDTFE